MTGIERIAAERKRQIEKEGWTAEHDAKFINGQLAGAAICYAMTENMRKFEGDMETGIMTRLWPFNKSWWKPSPDNRIRELEKAGALIAAEIDRLQAEANNDNK